MIFVSGSVNDAIEFEINGSRPRHKYALKDDKKKKLEYSLCAIRLIIKSNTITMQEWRKLFIMEIVFLPKNPLSELYELTYYLMRPFIERDSSVKTGGR